VNAVLAGDLDAAMYRVKVTGKNGIHVAGSEQDTSRAPAEEQELH